MPQLCSLSSLSSPITESDIESLISIFPEGVVFLDLETTGLSPMVDRIIEIGAIKIKPDRSIVIYNQLVHPLLIIPEQSTAIHGITNEMVKDQPDIKQVLPIFLNFMENMPIVAQNAKFDIGFLVFAIHQHKLYFPKSKVYDSCRMARKAQPDLKSYSLLSLAKHFKILQENHHRALEDSLVCLKVIGECLLISNSRDFRLQVKAAGYLFNTDDFRNLSSFDIPSNLQEILIQAMKKEVIEIEYRGGSFPNQFRPIRAVGLIPLPQGIVLYGLCFLSQSFKSFYLRKIKSIKLVSKDYQEMILRQHEEDRKDKDHA